MKFSVAAETDVETIALLRTAVGEHLTLKHGRGHWSTCVTEKSVLRGLRTSRVFAARQGKTVVATFTLATKKPWAIDLTYFSNIRRALYLHDMAVAPALQRKGIGRELLNEAITIGRSNTVDQMKRAHRRGGL